MRRLLGGHAVHTGFLEASPDVGRHGHRAMRAKQLNHVLHQWPVVRKDVLLGNTGHRNAISVSRRAIFEGSWHEKSDGWQVTSEKCRNLDAGSSEFHARTIRLEIDRDKKPVVEPDDEISLGHGGELTLAVLISKQRARNKSKSFSHRVR
jgi:hypothetical protein